MISRKNLSYFILVCFFSAGFLFSNLLGARIISFFSISLTAGTLTHPFTFILSDLVTEVWGERKARVMVLLGFIFCSLAFFLQVLFMNTFYLSGLLLLSSCLAFGVSQLFDIRLFQFLKIKTDSKHLWFRSQASVLLSQLIDTLIVNSLVLFCSFGLDFSTVMRVIFGSFLYKAFFSLTLIPFLYLSVFLLRKFLRDNTQEIYEV